MDKLTGANNDVNKDTEKTPESRIPPGGDGQSSPEACPICLSKVDNKSFTNNCFHTFCFVCIREWSKQKAECPLCKQKFKSIIHNVRSLDDYDEYSVENNNRRPDPYLSGDRRFRYRTTLTNDHTYDPWMTRQQQNYERQMALFERPSRSTTMTTARADWRRRRQTSTSDFRRRVYARGMRVKNINTSTGRVHRQREISPKFLQKNPACVHRLVPWLNRELNALLTEGDRANFVSGLILDLVRNFAIESDEFREHIRPYLNRHTDLFIHEFSCFARSPYDMTKYDQYAVYEEPAANVGSSSTSTASAAAADDDDIVIVSPAEQRGEPAAPRGGAARVAVSATFGAPSPSEPPTDFSDRFMTTLEMLLGGSSSVTASSGWDSPTPGASSMLWSPPRPTSPQPLSLTHDDTQPFSFLAASSSHTESASTGHARPSAVADSNGGADSDIEIIGFEKPFELRSPIALSSASDVEVVSAGGTDYTTKTKSKKKKRSRRSRDDSFRESSCERTLNTLLKKIDEQQKARDQGSREETERLQRDVTYLRAKLERLLDLGGMQRHSSSSRHKHKRDKQDRHREREQRKEYLHKHKKSSHSRKEERCSHDARKTRDENKDGRSGGKSPQKTMSSARSPDTVTDLHRNRPGESGRSGTSSSMLSPHSTSSLEKRETRKRSRQWETDTSESENSSYEARPSKIKSVVRVMSSEPQEEEIPVHNVPTSRSNSRSSWLLGMSSPSSGQAHSSSQEMTASGQDDYSWKNRTDKQVKKKKTPKAAFSDTSSDASGSDTAKSTSRELESPDRHTKPRKRTTSGRSSIRGPSTSSRKRTTSRSQSPRLDLVPPEPTRSKGRSSSVSFEGVSSSSRTSSVDSQENARRRRSRSNSPEPGPRHRSVNRQQRDSSCERTSQSSSPVKKPGARKVRYRPSRSRSTSSEGQESKSRSPSKGRAAKKSHERQRSNSRSKSRSFSSEKRRPQEKLRMKDTRKKSKSKSEAKLRSRSRSSDCLFYISRAKKCHASTTDSDSTSSISSVEFIVAKQSTRRKKHKKHKKKRFYVIDDSSDSEGNHGIEILNVVPATKLKREEKKHKQHHTGHKKSSKSKHDGGEAVPAKAREDRVRSTDSVELLGMEMPPFLGAEIDVLIPDLVLPTQEGATSLTRADPPDTGSPDELKRKCEVSSSLDVLEGIIGCKAREYDQFAINGEIVAYPLYGQERRSGQGDGSDSDRDTRKPFPSVKETIAAITDNTERALAQKREREEEERKENGGQKDGHEATSSDSDNRQTSELVPSEETSSTQSVNAAEAKGRKRPCLDPVLTSVAFKSPKCSDTETAEDSVVASSADETPQSRARPFEEDLHMSHDLKATSDDHADSAPDSTKGREETETVESSDEKSRLCKQPTEGFGVLPLSCDSHTRSPSKDPVLFAGHMASEQGHHHTSTTEAAASKETTAQTISSIMEAVQKGLSSRRSSQSEDSANDNSAEHEIEQKCREIAGVGGDKPKTPPPLAVENMFSLGGDEGSDTNDNDTQEISAPQSPDPNLYEQVGAIRRSPSRSASMILLASMNAQRVFNIPVTSTAENEPTSSTSPEKGVTLPDDDNRLTFEMAFPRQESLADISDIVGDLPGASPASASSTGLTGRERLDRVMSLTRMDLFEPDGEASSSIGGNKLETSVAPSSVTDVLQKDIQMNNGSGGEDLSSLERQMREKITARLEQQRDSPTRPNTEDLD